MAEARSPKPGYTLRNMNAASLLAEAGRQFLVVGLEAVLIGDAGAHQGVLGTTIERASMRAVLLR
jgi:hypothetical protein